VIVMSDRIEHLDARRASLPPATGRIGALLQRRCALNNDFEIYRARRQHRRLSEMIDYEAGLPRPDDRRIRELKRRKLALKDRLVVLEAGAQPA